MTTSSEFGAAMSELDAEAPQPRLIAVVGCGFVGSIFVEELAKRLFAAGLTPAFKLVLIDDDLWDERNSANQNTQPRSAGELKADCMADLLYEYGINAESFTSRLTQDNIEELLRDCELVVDAVDNYATRKLLWEFSIRTGVPVLHIGVSQSGTGTVEWTRGELWDNWTLSPLALRGKTPPANDIEELPPCELVALRGLGLNIGLAAAKATAIYLGSDPEQHVREAADPAQCLASWSAHNQGHELLSVVLFDNEQQAYTREVVR